MFIGLGDWQEGPHCDDPGMSEGKDLGSCGRGGRIRFHFRNSPLAAIGEEISVEGKSLGGMGMLEPRRGLLAGHTCTHAQTMCSGFGKEEFQEAEVSSLSRR